MILLSRSRGEGWISDVSGDLRDFVNEVLGISDIFDLGSVFGGLRGRIPYETVVNFRSFDSAFTLKISGELTYFFQTIEAIR